MYIKNNNVNKNVCNKDKYEDKKNGTKFQEYRFHILMM